MNDFAKPSIAVIGAGKVGTALALLLSRQGYPVVGVATEHGAAPPLLAAELGLTAAHPPEEISLKAQVVFITTPDRLIGPVAEEIQTKGGFRAGQVVFHTSGAQPAAEAGAARLAGAYVASLHPLQSFAHVAMALEHLPGSFFALEGDGPALAVAEQIVEDLGGRSMAITAKDKLLYHAAACVASNYLVSLMHLATGLYEKFGLSRREAFQALLPLVQGTIGNLRLLDPAQALTGPVARGDAQTVAGHLAALAAVGSQERELYRVLALYTLQVAREKGGVTPEQVAKLEEICKEAAIE